MAHISGSHAPFGCASVCRFLVARGTGASGARSIVASRGWRIQPGASAGPLHGVLLGCIDRFAGSAGRRRD